MTVSRCCWVDATWRTLLWYFTKYSVHPVKYFCPAGWRGRSVCLIMAEYYNHPVCNNGEAPSWPWKAFFFSPSLCYLISFRILRPYVCFFFFLLLKYFLQTSAMISSHVNNWILTLLSASLVICLDVVLGSRFFICHSVCIVIIAGIFIYYVCLFTLFCVGERKKVGNITEYYVLSLARYLLHVSAYIMHTGVWQLR